MSDLASLWTEGQESRDARGREAEDVGDGGDQGVIAKELSSKADGEGKVSALTARDNSTISRGVDSLTAQQEPTQQQAETLRSRGSGVGSEAGAASSGSRVSEGEAQNNEPGSQSSARIEDGAVSTKSSAPPGSLPEGSDEAGLSGVSLRFFLPCLRVVQEKLAPFPLGNT